MAWSEWKKFGGGDLVAKQISTSTSFTHEITQKGKYVIVVMAFSHDYANGQYGSLEITLNNSPMTRLVDFEEIGYPRCGRGIVTQVRELAVGDTIKVTGNSQQGVRTSVIYLAD
jgi:hypothetical protein